MLCGSKAGKAHTWLIVITEFLSFAFVSLVAVSRDGVFWLRTADPHIVVDDWEVLMPIPDRLVRSSNDLSFFPVISKMGCDLVLAYIAICRWPEVDWSCADLEDPYFLYC